jgi:chromosome segregation ATPase
VNHSDDHSIDWDGILKAAGEIGNSALTASPAPLRADSEAELESLRAQLAGESKKVKSLEDEVQRLKEELSQVNTQANTKKKRPRASESNLELKRNLESLRLETERLKLSYPLYDLLKAKELEVDQVERTLAELPADHVERSALQSIAKSHRAEKEQLSFLIEKAEARFRKHLEQINDCGALIPEEYHSHSAAPSVQIPEF